MARRLAFQFSDRPSPAAEWDIRLRVAAVTVFSPVVLFAEVWALVPLTLAMLGLLAWAGARWRDLGLILRNFAGFLAFLLIVGLGFHPTWDNARFLLQQSWRLILLLFSSHFLMLTATPLTVTAAIQWFTGWLGRRRAYYAASMAAWALASIPQVLDQVQVIREAALLRGVVLKRHPLRFLRLLTLSLMVRMVEKSLAMTWALEARSYGAAIPPPDLKTRPVDWLIFGAWLGLCLAAWWFGAWMLSIGA